jgi:hypothetical protein
VVIEWHQTPEHPAGDDDVVGLLQRLGYQVEQGLQGELSGVRFGLVWGYRD